MSGNDRYELITIGGQTFSLPSSYMDSSRRKQYFLTKQYEKDQNLLGEGVPVQSGGNGSKFFDEEILIEFRVKLSDNLFVTLVELRINKKHPNAEALRQRLQTIHTLGDDLFAKFIGRPLQIQSTQFLTTPDSKVVNEFLVPDSAMMGNIVTAILTQLLGSSAFVATMDEGNKAYSVSPDKITDTILKIPSLYLYSTYLTAEALKGVDEAKRSRILENRKNYQNVNLVYMTVPTQGELYKGKGELFPLVGEFQIQIDGNTAFTKPVGKQLESGTTPGRTTEPTTTTEPATTTEPTTTTTTEPTTTTTTITTTEPTSPYLKQEEIKILKALGFDRDLLGKLGDYLPEFFDSLPSCSTDTAMLLKKDCETAYFVLWSVMFAAQTALAERLKAQPSVAFLPDVQAGVTRQTTQSLFELHKKEDVSFDADILKQLFTLGFDVGAEFSESDIRALFSLSRRKITEDEAITRLLTVF